MQASHRKWCFSFTALFVGVAQALSIAPCHHIKVIRVVSIMTTTPPRARSVIGVICGSVLKLVIQNHSFEDLMADYKYHLRIFRVMSFKIFGMRYLSVYG